ncbi:jg26996 [Pararge aegeria aegeria]|uniref:polyribonucleotide nucleotidyltransferase n=1 Tax=Pararge aegeria aegeria TaxID=348720 RepID=A0A8S4RW47_9NEOP|nr:jg26996 [Pararge aegeria aegeria]
MLPKNTAYLTKLRPRSRYHWRFLSSQTNIGEIEVPFSNGIPLKLSSGRYARFADGACVATLGNTSVLSTVVSKAKQSSSNFLPLLVDYRQKAAAAGRIPTNFLRKELGPTEREILTSRLIDRSLRPLFPQNYNFDTQIVCNMLAVDSTNPPETVAINAASAALALSDVPWNGPVGAVRLGQIDNEIIINPTRRDLEKSNLNLVVAATASNLVVMLEGHANVILQQDLLKAIKLGTKEAQHVVKSIQALQKSHGKTKREYEVQVPIDQSVLDSVRTLSSMKIREILSDAGHDKMSRDNAISEVRQTVLNQLRATEVDVTILQDCFNTNLRKIFRDMIFETELRCDGRELDELRKISCEVGLYEPLHGSALFQRGQTQVLCTVAFDSPESALKMDTLTMITSGVKEKNFFLHYEFPSYATGEVGRSGPAGRREAGHGALAERGLLPIVPQQQCTTRLTAEVLESNVPETCFRQGRKENMPVMEEMEVEVHKRAKLLGIGGSNLKRLYLETGVQISPIDETRYSVFAPSQAAMEEARTRIAANLATERTPELEFGAIYTAKVVEMKDIGVLVTLYSGMSPALVHNSQLDHRKVVEMKDIGVLVTLYSGMSPALVHNSQLDHRKIMHPSVLGLDVGSEIQVKYFGRDPVSGQVRLSRKVLTSPPPGIVRKLDKN